MKLIFKIAAFFMIISSFVGPLAAQTVDSIFFNLYTDSLKKGTYNYINVDGKFSDGRYLPLSTKELRLFSTAGKFDGNSLYIEKTDTVLKVTVSAELIKNPRIREEREIYIKQHESTEKLPTMDEIMNRKPASGNKEQNNRTKRKRGR